MVMNGRLKMINLKGMSYFYCFLCLALLGACGGKSTKSVATQAKVAKPETKAMAKKDEVKYVNSVQFVSPEKNKLYSFGEELELSFAVQKKFSIDSSRLTMNGKTIARLGKDVKQFRFKLPEGEVGDNAIKVIVYHPDNKRGVASVNIKVKPAKAPQQLSYELVRTYPHDPKAYTQGLIYHDGYMYEGTGQYGESTLRKTDMATGKTLSVLSLDGQFFGEGVTIYKDKIYQITWRSGKGFMYDLNTFSLKSTFTYNSEGWGITTVNDVLVMSDGSHKLYHIVPSNFNRIKEVEVYDHKGEVSHLNELEYVNGLLWANVWLTDRIVAIDPETGVVKAELNMPHLLTAAEKAKIDIRDDVLNGIAWNPEKNTFYVTGKRWPKMFEINIKGLTNE